MFPDYDLLDDDILGIHCKKCKKPFVTTIQLEEHQQLALCREKRFECSYCDFQTSAKFSLKRHIDTKHMRPKDAKASFKCPKCPRSYFHKHSLIYHLKNECGVEPNYFCSFCAFRTKNQFTLLSHLRKHHNKT